MSVHVLVCLINSPLLTSMAFWDNWLFSPRAKNCAGESSFLAEASLQSSLKMEAN